LVGPPLARFFEEGGGVAESVESFESVKRVASRSESGRQA